MTYIRIAIGKKIKQVDKGKGKVFGEPDKNYSFSKCILQVHCLISAKQNLITSQTIHEIPKMDVYIVRMCFIHCK